MEEKSFLMCFENIGKFLVFGAEIVRWTVDNVFPKY
jgi:hypothetical protein